LADNTLDVIGGGLAGVEAAWRAANAGVRVRLHEMRPVRNTPAHHSAKLAELVCSNSLRSADMHNAVGLLKEEMKLMGSLVLDAAERTKVPAGSALAVDRELFADYITEKIESHENIEVVREEVMEIPDGPVVLATGPLTSEAMTEAIARLTGAEHLHFYDAIAPILEADSIDMDIAFMASRYGKGGADYINCPMNETEYNAFIDAIIEADMVPVRDFESVKCFEGCMPIEEIVSRGRETLRHGPMKPMGITDPRTDSMPHAVVQLRTENDERSAYNIVGFQTRLKHPEQKRVFQMIPGLEHAEFMRYGSLHRNTFINAPAFMDEHLMFKVRPGLFIAGQLSGVEGYVESAAMGILAGLNGAKYIRGEGLVTPPETSAHGALVTHLTKTEPKRFQPSNVIFSLFPPLGQRIKQKAQRREAMAKRALDDVSRWIEEG
jgi:methylenetetrahydrofolate--tRNA-(uracil-5-)-methyltransferase